MSWSKIAFGAARCAKGVAEHEAALTRALQGGITGKCTNSILYYLQVVLLELMEQYNSSTFPHTR